MVNDIIQSPTEFSLECIDKENNLFWLNFTSTDNGLMMSLEHSCLLHPFEITPDKHTLHQLKQFINTFN